MSETNNTKAKSAEQKAPEQKAAEPTVSSDPQLEVGGKAKHKNGLVYEVLEIHGNSAKLKNVANLVALSALTPVK